MNCIETTDLFFRFSKNETVLHNINLQIPTGTIYGFLGPNGAGKTTTLKLILGLLKQQHGTIQIFNQRFETNRIGILKKTGSLIESPSLYSNLTARENLRVFQMVYRCPQSRIPKVLEWVGLENTGNKKVGQFSLGMKQRLSIAMALLHEPSLLILDEPSNGLDPNGIIEIRELLRKLNKELGMTIVISSHLLPEIEKLVSHIGIINKGNLLFQGTLNELHAMQNQSSFTRFDTGDPTRATEIAVAFGISATCFNDQVILPSIEKEVISRLNEQLVKNRIKVYQITMKTNDLESIFIELTKN